MCLLNLTWVEEISGNFFGLFLPVTGRHPSVSRKLPCFSGHTVTGCFSNSSVYSTAPGADDLPEALEHRR